MEKTDKRIALWKEAIPRMNEEDLEFILDFSECFEPQMVKMVKARYKQMSITPDDENENQNGEEDVVGAVFNILDEMGCQSKYDKDGDIQFFYQDESFFITGDEDNPFIDIWEYNWMQVSLNEINKISVLRQAINEINHIGDITITYSIDKDCNEIHVHCGTRILFFSFIPNRKGYLEYVLNRFFDTHRFLEGRLQELYEIKYSNEITS